MTKKEKLSREIKGILGVRQVCYSGIYMFGFSAENRTHNEQIFEDKSAIISELNGLKQRLENEITQHIREIEDIQVS